MCFLLATVDMIWPLYGLPRNFRVGDQNEHSTYQIGIPQPKVLSCCRREDWGLTNIGICFYCRKFDFPKALPINGVMAHPFQFRGSAQSCWRTIIRIPTWLNKSMVERPYQCLHTYYCWGLGFEISVECIHQNSH